MSRRRFIGVPTADAFMRRSPRWQWRPPGFRVCAVIAVLICVVFVAVWV